jgi:biopolymer transport protein ExbB
MQVGIDQFGTKRRVMEELFYEKLISIRPKLDRLLPFLAVTAAAAPLMGLLGTVTGMIKTFALITEFGTGDARSLSSGISEALVTTELGLIVAIPILVIHGILVRMSRGKVGRMEGAAMAFLNSFSRRETQIAA